MKFLIGSPCYCGSNKRVEDCCIDFDSHVSHGNQVRIRQKYRSYSDDEEIPLLAIHSDKGIELKEYTLTEFDEEKIGRCTKILSEKAEIMTFSELFFNEYFGLMSYCNHIEDFENNELDNEINRLVINFVSNAKLFIDFLENKVKKNYPDFYPSWKERQSSFFDETFEYSFLYHLRNHVQHVGMPIQTIKSRLVIVDNEEKKVTSFNLSQTSLLNDKNLHKKVRENLSALGDLEEISFVPIASEYHSMIKNLYLLSLQAFIRHHEIELSRLSDYFEDNNLTNKMFKTKIIKRNYLKRNLEGMTMNPLTTKYNIIKEIIELSELGVINLELERPLSPLK